MKKLIFLLAALPLMCIASYAQDTPAPGPDFPDYIVKPSEDLNPYGLSSLGTSSGNDYRDGSGTLGTKTTGRPSNIEVNKKAEEKKAASEENQANAEQSDPLEEIVVEDDSAVQNFSSSPKSSNSRLIRWVDDDGVTHITNNEGSIPAKYRNQVK